MSQTIYIPMGQEATDDDFRLVGSSVALLRMQSIVLPEDKVSEYYFNRITALKEVRIFGYIEDRSLYLNDIRIESKYSQSVRNHSPDGFNWGYYGSGCAQTALAIMLEVVPIDLARTMYQKFKSDFVAKWEEGKDFDVKINIYDWLNKCFTENNYHSE